MIKKKFGLEGILKVRTYQEMRALQEFARKTREDRELATHQEFFKSERERNVRVLQRQNGDAYVSVSDNPVEREKRVYDYMGDLHTKGKLLAERRTLLKDSVEKAKEEYRPARVALESIKILKEIHNKEHKKFRNKKFYDDLQERSL